MIRNPYATLFSSLLRAPPPDRHPQGVPTRLLQRPRARPLPARLRRAAVSNHPKAPRRVISRQRAPLPSPSDPLLPLVGKVASAAGLDGLGPIIGAARAIASGDPLAIAGALPGVLPSLGSFAPALAGAAPFAIAAGAIAIPLAALAFGKSEAQLLAEANAAGQAALQHLRPGQYTNVGETGRTGKYLD